MISLRHFCVPRNNSPFVAIPFQLATLYNGQSTKDKLFYCTLSNITVSMKEQLPYNIRNNAISSVSLRSFHSLVCPKNNHSNSSNDNKQSHQTMQVQHTKLASRCRGMKIYTKTGDRGTSGTLTGTRFPKDHMLFEALGNIDELSAHIGLAKEVGQERKHPYSDQLERIQCLLQDAASAIARSPPAAVSEADDAPSSTAKPPCPTCVDTTHVEELEAWIDHYTAELPQLKNFILPGGGHTAAGLHVARATCRRAERSVVALLPHYAVDNHVVVYINRLSDYLFTIARTATVLDESKEVIYINPGRSKTPNIDQSTQTITDS